MSRVPFLDELEQAFARALAGEPAARAPRRRRRPQGLAAAAAAFATVLLVGAATLALLARDDPPPLVPTTLFDDPSGVGLDEWAQLHHQPAFGEQGRTLLSGVVHAGGRFVAVGAQYLGDESTGLVLTSVDGLDWAQVLEAEGVSFQDVAVGEAVAVAVGVAIGGDLGPVVAVSRDDAAWQVHAVAREAEEAVAQMNAVTAHGSGFVAVGQAMSDDGRHRPAVWSSGDGVTWSRVAGDSFEWGMEHGLSDVVSAHGLLVAVGTRTVAEGESVPVGWRSTDGRAWTMATMPSRAGVFARAAAVTATDDGFLAAGSEDGPASGGSTGAMWSSADGRTWRRLPDPDGILATQPSASTVIHDLVVVPGGYLAVGSALERPTSRQVFWTAGYDLSWTRIDLVDPGNTWTGAVAVAAAAATERVVVVGWHADLTGEEGEAAVWVSPVPEPLMAMVPLAGPPVAPGPDDVIVDVDPPLAVAETRVRVTGRLPAPGDEPVRVLLVGADGAAVEACSSALLGRRFDCRFRIADLGDRLPPGSYSVAVGEPEATVPGAILEVVPAGTEIVALRGTYQPTLWPLLTALTVRNHGAAAVDVSGWELRARSAVFTFPPGTSIQPGGSVTLWTGQPAGAFCLADTRVLFQWCNTYAPGGRWSGSGTDAFWGGGDVTLVDGAGESRGTWTPPRG